MQIITYNKGYRPKKMGEAELFFDDSRYFPKRDGKKIVIPDRDEALLFEHKEKPIFLLVYNGDVWFGGTDEHTFLVQLSTDKYEPIDWIRLWRNGEFEDTLAPYAMKVLLKIFNYQPKRQGDIWALPLTTDDWELFVSLSYLFRSTYSPKIKEADEFPIFGTRHILKGRYAQFDKGLVAQGTLMAPDHQDLEIKKNLHLIFQNDHLLDPRRAD